MIALNIIIQITIIITLNKQNQAKSNKLILVIRPFISVFK